MSNIKTFRIMFAKKSRRFWIFKNQNKWKTFLKKKKDPLT